jgi:hypothetical protein
VKDQVGTHITMLEELIERIGHDVGSLTASDVGRLEVVEGLIRFVILEHRREEHWCKVT